MKIGKISETVLKRSVLKQLTNRRNEVRLGAVPGEDCAVLAFESGEQTLVSTQSAEGWRMEASADREKEAAAGPQSDCVKEYAAVCAQGAAVSTGRDAVLYGLHRALNNIAAEGGKPVAVFLSLLLPPSFEERGLKAMMVQAEEVCAALGVQIAGGHTAVTDAVCRPAATVTAVGKAVPERILPTGGARPGADLVVTKWVALEGTAVAVKEKEAELLKRFPAYLVEEAKGFDRYLSILPEAGIVSAAEAVSGGMAGAAGSEREAKASAAAGSEREGKASAAAEGVREGKAADFAQAAGAYPPAFRVQAMTDVSEGGIFAALWKLAEASGVGLEVDLKKLPIRQETVEICNFLDLNPYGLASSGSLLIAAKDGAGLAGLLERNGIPACVVGRTTEGNDRILRNGEEKRFLEPGKPDERYRIGTASEQERPL